MKEHEVREGDIVRIEYDTKFAKEHIDEGEALILWKGINRQPLVVKLANLKNGKYNPGWTCYEYIAEVVGHMSIVDMLKSQCGLGTLDSPTTNGVADSISREELGKSEEAKISIDYLKDMQEAYIEGEGYERHPLPEWYALDYAIATILKAENCEDCISRQAVIDIIFESGSSFENNLARGFFIDKIRDLPSVTPRPKTGRSSDDVNEALNMAIKALDQQPVKKCTWIKYDYRTMCPKEHDVDNPYWRIPENRMETLKYCPYCGKEIEVSE